MEVIADYLKIAMGENPQFAEEVQVLITEINTEFIDWRQVCNKMLEAYPLHQQSTKKHFESEIYIALGLME